MDTRGMKGEKQNLLTVALPGDAFIVAGLSG